MSIVGCTVQQQQGMAPEENLVCWHSYCWLQSTSFAKYCNGLRTRATNPLKVTFITHNLSYITNVPSPEVRKIPSAVIVLFQYRKTTQCYIQKPSGSPYARAVGSWGPPRKTETRKTGKCDNRHLDVKPASEFFHAKLIICIILPDNPVEYLKRVTSIETWPRIGHWSTS
jgi:hypothetical protein